jgi:hypothetical protein
VYRPRHVPVDRSSLGSTRPDGVIVQSNFGVARQDRYSALFDDDGWF